MHKVNSQNIFFKNDKKKRFVHLSCNRPLLFFISFHCSIELSESGKFLFFFFYLNEYKEKLFGFVMFFDFNIIVLRDQLDKIAAINHLFHGDDTDFSFFQNVDFSITGLVHRNGLCLSRVVV